MVLEGMMSVEGMVWWCWKERCLWNGWCDGVGRNDVCGRDGVVVMHFRRNDVCGMNGVMVLEGMVSVEGMLGWCWKE